MVTLSKPTRAQLVPNTACCALAGMTRLHSVNCTHTPGTRKKHGFKQSAHRESWINQNKLSVWGYPFPRPRFHIIMTTAYLSSNALLSSWLFCTVASKTAMSPRKSSVCFSSSLTRLWLLCHSFFMVARFSFRAVTCMVSLVSFSSCFRFSSSFSFFSVC